MKLEIHEDHFILDGDNAILFGPLEIINKQSHLDNQKSMVRNFVSFGEMDFRFKVRASLLVLRRIWAT